MVENEGEDNRVLKKRRTPSGGPETNGGQPQTGIETAHDALPEAFLDEELEADPEGDQWADFDAEDVDDPLMVSKNVIDIFRYMSFLLLLRPLVMRRRRHDVHREPEGPRSEHARHPQ
jgi:hypothetical protein